MDKKFAISVSTESYEDKNCVNWGQVCYQKQNLTIEDFIHLVKQGHCFCHIFNTQGITFGVKEKNKEAFVEAYVVFVDIDNSIIPMGEYITKLSYKPTVAYTTPNNYSAKSNWMYRFRLCYLLKKPITDVDKYRTVYHSIVNRIESDIEGFHNNDNCGQSVSQQFGGNGSGNCEVWQSDEVYSTDVLFGNTDFPILKHKQQRSHFGALNRSCEIKDEEFMQDLKAMSPLELLWKYRERYPYFDRTPLTYNEGYALLPPTYTQIRRKLTFDSFYKDNGDLKTWLKVKRIKDGEGRRNKLYISSLIRKQILPTICLEHLLYNLIWDRHYFFDNTDKELTNECLLKIAQSVVSTQSSDIRIPLYRPKEYEIDKEYCFQRGISPNEMKNKVRRRLNDKKIGECYDLSKSVAENLILLNELGLKVGRSKLYQWCKENGVNPNPTQESIPILETTQCLSVASLNRPKSGMVA